MITWYTLIMKEQAHKKGRTHKWLKSHQKLAGTSLCGCWGFWLRYIYEMKRLCGKTARFQNSCVVPFRCGWNSRVLPAAFRRARAMPSHFVGVGSSAPPVEVMGAAFPKTMFLNQWPDLMLPLSGSLLNCWTNHTVGGKIIAKHRNFT